MNQLSKIEALQVSLAEFEREWNKANLSVEIGAAEASRLVTDPEERKIQRYSLSSANRRRFMMYLVRAYYDGERISWHQLYQSLNISRNALQTMIDECVDAKWICECKGKKKTDSTFLAAKSLVNAYDNYGSWARRACRNVGLPRFAMSIIEIKALIDLESPEVN